MADKEEEKVQKEEPEKKIEEPPKEEPKETGALENFLNEEPVSAEEVSKAMKTAKEDINKKIEAEDKEPPVKEPKEKEKEKKSEPEPKKTPLTDEDRKAFNVPERFKYREDFTAWGSEAEKKLNEVLLERDKLKQGGGETEEKLAQLETALKEVTDRLSKDVKAGDITEEEKKIEEEELRILRENDPAEYVDRLLQIRDKQQNTQKIEAEKKQQKEQAEKQEKEKRDFWMSETRDLVKLFGGGTDEAAVEKGLKEYERLKPEFAKITAEEPGIRSLKTVYKIYLQRQKDEQETIEADAEAKRKEKLKAASETSVSEGHEGDETILAEIEDAKGKENLSEKELAALKNKINKKYK